MKLALIIVLVSSLQAIAIDGASQKRISLDIKSSSIPDVLRFIEKRYEYRFFYESELKNYQEKVDVYAKGATIDYVMQQLLENTSFLYKKMNNGLVVIVGSPVTINKILPIKGKITDANGAPLPGVTIVEKGTSNGIATDENGDFSLFVKDETAVLVITMVGYKTEEITVKNTDNILIALTPLDVKMDDVVVIGYGTQKKITTTGAVGTISSKELVQSPVANISNSMAGRVPGLFAMQSSGEPGYDQSRILIRGISTFEGTTDPFVLVDGIETNNYNSIDPNEIESVSILKDASSTAVYGMRGANGVIIITTKRGKIGPPQVSYSFNQGFNSFTDLRDGMTSTEFANNYNQAQLAEQYITNSYTRLRFSPLDIELYENGSDPIFHSNVNWAKKMFRKNAPQAQHNLTLSGGQERVKYFMSAGFFNQEGMFKDFSYLNNEYDPQSIFRRINTRANFNFDVTKDLKVLLDLSSQTEFRSGNNYSNGGTRRIIGQVMRAAPIEGPGEYDGKIIKLPYGSYNNPVLDYLFPEGVGGVKKYYTNYLNGLLRADYGLDAITKGLSVHGSVALQTFYDQQTINGKRIVVYTVFKLPDGTLNFRPDNNETAFSFNKYSTFNRRVTGEFGFNYKRNFGDHNVTALLIYKQTKLYSSTIQYLIPKGYQDYVGRVTYDYKNKYMVEFDAGYNGSENFAVDKRFGFFPAYSAGWVPSNESFFPKNNIVNFLKIRATYGEVGNDNLGNFSRFLYRPTSYSIISDMYFFGIPGQTYGSYSGALEGVPGNPNVTWERAVKKNLGFESRFFKDKLDITFDIWSELRNNILSIPNTYSAISGVVQSPTNLGKMQNKGYEGQATFRNHIGNLNYRVSANYSFARNKILFRDEISHTYAYQYVTGLSLGQPFALYVDGIFNTWEEVNDASRPVYEFVSNKIQPGDLKYRDINGDGIVNGFDMVPLGYPRVPEKIFGISLGLDYKGFDFSVLFQGASNTSYLYSAYQRTAGFAVQPYQGSPAYLNESWTFDRYENGLPIKFPRHALANNPNNLTNSFFMVDASYMRIKNAEVGYTFGSNLLERFKIKSLRLYANANNLFTWSNMLPGIDPEAIGTGSVVEENYPLVRTVNLGINVKF